MQPGFVSGPTLAFALCPDTTAQAQVTDRCIQDYV